MITTKSVKIKNRNINEGKDSPQKMTYYRITTFDRLYIIVTGINMNDLKLV